MSQYDFYLFENGKVPGDDQSVKIPVELLPALDLKSHFVFVVKDGMSDQELRSQDDILGFMDARAKALSWADKPLDMENVSLEEALLLASPLTEQTPIGSAEAKWRFFVYTRPASEGAAEIPEEDLALIDFATQKVVAEHTDGTVKVIENLDDLREFWGEAAPELVIEQKEMDMVNKAVDPNHYKGYIDDLQWIDAMSKIPSLREPARFIAALELQIRKYMDRNGAKDLTIQEWKKARFYMVYLVAYIENDYVCVTATEIHKRIQGL